MPQPGADFPEVPGTYSGKSLEPILELDYFEVSSLAKAQAAVDRLLGAPGLYRAMGRTAGPTPPTSRPKRICRLGETAV